MKKEFIDIISAENSPVFQGLFSALTTTAPVTSLRLNPRKAQKLPELVSSKADGQVPWEPNGFYLSERINFTSDPSLHQGLYYVQDASSMILGEITRQISRMAENRPLTVLDACAAPGGKTTAVADSLPPESVLIANEYDFQRAEILKENVAKWGLGNIMVTRGDTARFSKLPDTFDMIIVDAPCSGEGMFRKDPYAIEQWSPELVRKCASRQREILDNLVTALAPDGYLVYSTCTFNTEENEKIVDYLVTEHGLEYVTMDFPTSWNIQPGVNTSYPCYRFLPSRLKGEGLFVAVMRKNAGNKVNRMKAVKSAPPKKSLIDWTDNLVTFKDDTMIYGAEPRLLEFYKQNAKKIGGVLSPGIEIATVKGEDYVPSQALALSLNLRPDAFPRHDVSYEDALSYLSRENVFFPSDIEKGYILLTFRNLPLGFVKNLGRRANNLYPKEWRIKTKSVQPHGNTPPS